MKRENGPRPLETLQFPCLYDPVAVSLKGGWFALKQTGRTVMGVTLGYPAPPTMSGLEEN